MRTVLIAGLLALTSGATAGEPVKVADLGWLAGTWVQTKGESVVRETWLPAQDGLAAGVSVTSKPGRTPFHEFMTLKDGPTGPVFTAYLDGQAPTAFAAIEATPERVVFENTANDFPHRVIYARCGEDLCARIEGVIDGQPKGQDWRYTRER